jgi:hypothetical protein
MVSLKRQSRALNIFIPLNNAHISNSGEMIEMTVLLNNFNR